MNNTVSILFFHVKNKHQHFYQELQLIGRSIYSIKQFSAYVFIFRIVSLRSLPISSSMQLAVKIDRFRNTRAWMISGKGRNRSSYSSKQYTYIFQGRRFRENLMGHSNIWRMSCDRIAWARLASDYDASPKTHGRRIYFVEQHRSSSYIFLSWRDGNRDDIITIPFIRVYIKIDS